MPSLQFEPMMESRPIREIAYEVLKHAIVTGEIPAGERIVETDYADKLHISRTPLREALRKLERDGLVEYVLRRGVVVRAFTIQDVEQIYTIRNALEMLTLPYLIENAKPEDLEPLREMLREIDRKVAAKAPNNQISPISRSFHRNLTNLSAQNRIIRVIETQDEYINRFSAMAMDQEDNMAQAQQEHYDMLTYVEQGELEKLQALTKHHIERSRETCLKALELQHSKMNL